MQPVLIRRFSLVIPIYRNEESLPDLLDAVVALDADLDHQMEVIFVIDGSPDRSYELLSERLPSFSVATKLVLLSRNFGSFAAIREGLSHAEGEYAAVMAADLQEPPELVSQFFRTLEKSNKDVVFGVRESRQDPLTSKIASSMFWGLYRRLVQPDVPAGGVDVFAVNRRFLDRLVAFKEANSSLLGLLFWMGGRREFISYSRRQRQHGKSAWTFRKKFNYLLDSTFAFTDAPVKILLSVGLLGITVSALLAAIVLAAKFANVVSVPGYAGTMLTVLFFGGLNALGLGLVGNYAWRAYENTKQRPLSIVVATNVFPSPEESEITDE